MAGGRRHNAPRPDDSRPVKGGHRFQQTEGGSEELTTQRLNTTHSVKRIAPPQHLGVQL